MPESLPDRAVVAQEAAVVSRTTAVPDPRVTASGEAALAQAQALARRAAAPATLRAYKADWTHYASWCAQAGFVPVPAAPATVGAYLASLGETHAPTTIRRRLSAIGKMHRFNDLPWNPAHRDIQEPLRGLLRQHGRPPQKAAPLTLAMLRRLLATCDAKCARPARPRTPAVRLRRRAAPLRTRGAARRRRRRGRGRAAAAHSAQQDRPDGAGGGDRPAARQACRNLPGAGFRGVAGGGPPKAGPLFRRISSGGRIGEAALHPDAVRRILAQRAGMAGLELDGFERLSAHALRVGFITEAYGKGVRDEDIMRHTRHRDLRTMRGYVQRAGLVTESPAGMLDL